MKQIKLEKEATDSLLVGLNKAVETVKLTMGGRGRMIVLDTPGKTNPTSDGVKVLRHVAMTDKTEDMGVKTVLEVAERQVKECEDGTTSVSVLLQAIIKRGMKNITAGSNPIMIRRGIKKAAEFSVDVIDKMSKKIKRDSDEVRQIATVSAHGDSEVADLIVEAVNLTNEHSIVRAEETPHKGSYVEYVDGMKVGSGWLSPLFINNPEKMTCDFDEAYVLIYEGKIDNMRDILHLLEWVDQKKKKLVIVSDNMDGEVLSSLAINAQRGLKIAAINAFGFDRNDAKMRLEDLSIATGGKLVTPDLGHELVDVSPEDLGLCKKIIISEEQTIFEGGNAEEGALNKRIKEVETQLKDAKGKTSEEFVRGRLASISGGIGTIYVGGYVESDRSEKKDRVDDALGAVLCALEDGVVPGGGVSLIHAAGQLANLEADNEDEQIGINIFRDALEVPTHQILTNAGQKPDFIIEKIKDNKSSSYGYNVYNDTFCDMIKEGILDPAKVEKHVINNASTVAANFLNYAGTIAPPQPKN
jgi:chaperonin GroEL